MKNTPENQVKREIKDWLTINGWFHFPVTQGLGSYPGIPDRIAIKNGIVLFIECKAEKGKLSQNQIQFAIDVKKHGGDYVLAYGYEDIVHYFEGEQLCLPFTPNDPKPKPITQ